MYGRGSAREGWVLGGRRDDPIGGAGGWIAATRGEREGEEEGNGGE